MDSEIRNRPQGITAWPENERPRERLLHHGPYALTNAELLAILLRVGLQGTNAVELGRSCCSGLEACAGWLKHPCRRSLM
ncbi:MAG: UPF0758 domain-containing protein [Gammaproteobacteria bacterium]